MDASNKYVHIKSTCFDVKFSLCNVSNDRMSRKCKQGHYLQATLQNYANIKSADKSPHYNLLSYNSLLASNVPVSLWERKEGHGATH